MAQGSFLLATGAHTGTTTRSPRHAVPTRRHNSIDRRLRAVHEQACPACPVPDEPARYVAARRVGLAAPVSGGAAARL